MTSVRSLDWRFLLEPRARRLAVITGASAETLAVATSLGLAEIVVGHVPEGSTADLIAIPASNGVGDIHALGDLAGRLAPGGQLYVEIDWRLAWRVRAIDAIRQLQENGLTLDGAWAVRPAFDRCETFVSLLHPSQLRWFLQHQYQARSRLQRVARSALGVLVRNDGRRFLRWSPYTAIVASSSPRDVDSVCTTMLLVDGGNRAVVLVFPAASAGPTSVVKIPKLPSFEDRTIHEHRMLVTLQGSLSAPMAATIPRPIGMRRWGHVHATTESVLVGDLLSKRCLSRTPDRAAEDLHDAAQWLSDFVAATRTGAPMSDVDFDRWFSAPFARYLELFGTAEEALLDAALCRGRRLHDAAPLPIVIRHRDFNIWNLLRLADEPAQGGPGIGVVDWEGAEPGPPLTDLVHLCTHWHEAVRRSRPISPDPEGLRRFVVERRRDEFPDADVALVFDRGLDALGIDDAWYPVIVVATWVELALRRDRQLHDGSLQQSDREVRVDGGDRDDNIGVQYLEVLRPHTDVMFNSEPGR